MIIFRIIRNLIRLGLNLLWLPFNLIGRNLFGLILLVGVIGFFIMLDSDDSVEQRDIAIPAKSVQGQFALEGAARTPPAPPARPQNAPAFAIDPVRVEENGNSSFAKDLLKLMTDDERGYYSQIFYWSMNNIPTGKTQEWANGNTYGSITPQAIFFNKRDHACRKFTEVLKAKDTKQTIKGIACQRGGGAWCKLGPNATPMCGLGQAPSFWRDIKRSVGL